MFISSSLLDLTLKISFRLPAHSAQLHDRRPTQHRRQPVRLAHRLLLRRHPGRDEGGEARAPEPGGHRPGGAEAAAAGQPDGRHASEKIRPDQVKRPRLFVNQRPGFHHDSDVII